MQSDDYKRYAFSGYDGKRRLFCRRMLASSRRPIVRPLVEDPFADPDDVAIDEYRGIKFDGKLHDLQTTLAFERQTSTRFMEHPLSFLQNLTSDKRLRIEVDVPFYDSELQQKLADDEQTVPCFEQCPDSVLEQNATLAGVNVISRVELPPSATLALLFKDGKIAGVQLIVYDRKCEFEVLPDKLPDDISLRRAFTVLTSTTASFWHIDWISSGQRALADEFGYQLPVGWLSHTVSWPQFTIYSGPWRTRTQAVEVVQRKLEFLHFRDNSAIVSNLSAPNHEFVMQRQAIIGALGIERTNSFGHLIERHVKWDFHLTWHSQHAFALGFAIAMAPLHLPAYVLLWILEQTPKMMHAPHTTLITLLQRVGDFYRKMLDRCEEEESKKIKSVV